MLLLLLKDRVDGLELDDDLDGVGGRVAGLLEVDDDDDDASLPRMPRIFRDLLTRRDNYLVIDTDASPWGRFD